MTGVQTCALPIYESEKLHSLVESSSDDEFGYDSDNKSEDDNKTHVGDEREQK